MKNLLHLIQAQPHVTPEALATIAGCAVSTAKRKIYEVRRIERLTGLPVTSWNLTRQSACGDCGVRLVMNAATGDAREYCDACRVRRRARSQKKYEAKRSEEMKRQRSGRTIGGVWMHRTRIARGVTFLREHPDASTRDFAAAMEMGHDAASFILPHLRELSHH